MALLKEWMVTRAVIEQSVTCARANWFAVTPALPFARLSGPTTRCLTDGSGSTSRSNAPS
jgi:hypothetical protein